MGTPLPVFYDCHNCPSYCCTYPRIEVTKTDLSRLALYLDVSPERVRRRYTKKGWDPGERVLRHQRDDVFGSACVFLDTTTRLCTVHEARPDICNGHTTGPTCGYYTFLMAERKDQNDPDLVVRAYNVPGEWPELEEGDR